MTGPSPARPRPHLRRARAAGAAALTVLLAACATSTLRVEPPDPPEDVAAECRALHERLPGEVLGEARRETAPRSDLTAAWGDIVLSCGVDEPEAFDATSQLFTIGGVDWFAEELTRGTRFTAVGRVALVQVDVADEYEPEADALVDLAEAVAQVPVED